jgi:MFS family permease
MRIADVQTSFLLNNRQLWSIGSIVMIRSIGFGATWPFMAIFFQSVLGVPVYYVGIIFGILAVLSTFFQIIGGHLADFSGRRVTMALGSFLGILIYGGIIAGLLFHMPILLIVILFIATSISGGLLFPAATATVADVTSSKDRERGYAIYRIMANVGWAVGPLIGSQIWNSGVVWIFAVV